MDGFKTVETLRIFSLKVFIPADFPHSEISLLKVNFFHRHNYDSCEITNYKRRILTISTLACQTFLYNTTRRILLNPMGYAILIEIFFNPQQENTHKSPTPMTKQNITRYSDIDWLLLRKNAMAQKGWKRKGPKEWDNKAKSFSSRTKHNDYVKLFLEELPLNPTLSVLDIGSGPGTLALPIAKRVHNVTALDFSKGMLDTLNQHAQEEHTENIRTVHCSWEDDWQDAGIRPHDLAIASRSVGIEDLEHALEKINSFATKYVFISDRIAATPFEEGAFHAIGRRFQPGPDYIFTLNILYKMGIFPNVTVLKPDPVTTYSSIEDALASYQWMFQELSTTEEHELLNYIKQNIIHISDHTVTVKRNSPVQWALIWWKKSA